MLLSPSSAARRSDPVRSNRAARLLGLVRKPKRYDLRRPFAPPLLRRYELSDDQWDAIAPLLPPAAKTGRPARDARQTLNGIVWRLCSGAAWRDVPERYGPWRAVNDRFCRYRDDGTLDRILSALRVRLDASGHIDYSTWMVDGTVIRASRSAAGARKRGARTRRSGARGAG